MSNIAVLTDEQGNPIGQKDRSEIAKGDIVAISSLLVVNSKGEILLAQRSFEKKVGPGLWGPAAAGTLEPGETFYTNIVKEAEEEIGLTNIRPAEVYRLHYWRQDGIGRYNVWFAVVVDQALDTFRLQAEEVAAVRWVSTDALLEELKADPYHFTGQGDLKRWHKAIELAKAL